MSLSFINIFCIFISVEVLAVAFQEDNQPEIFDEGFKMSLETLPKAGHIKTIPWSDTYWPTHKGGISYRWNKVDCPEISEEGRYSYPIGSSLPKLSCLSPAEKFDLLMGDKKWTLTNYERQRTGILKTIPGSKEFIAGFEIPKWEGICHAWAPATIAYEEPQPGLLKNPEGVIIPFGSSDIKALMAFGIHLESPIIPKFRNSTRFVGTRCEENFKELNESLRTGKISRNEFVKRINNARCTEDINAGAFHIILTNQIGIKGEAFIMDRTRDAEVWNQPLFAYDYEIYPLNARIPEDAHPRTESLVRIIMKVKMVIEIEPNWRGRPYFSDKDLSIKEEKYDYILELGANGIILGGKWNSDNRPDFVWKKTRVDAFQSIITALKPYYEFSISDRLSELSKFKKLAKRAGYRALAQPVWVDKYLELFSDKKNFNYKFHKELYDAVNEKRKADIKNLKFWLRHGARPDFKPGDELGVNHAIMLEDLEILKMLVDVGGTVKSTLANAMNAKNSEILKFVLKNGANREVGFEFDGQTIPAIHLAAFANDVERVKILLENGFDEFVNWTDRDGENALFFSLWASKGNPSIKTRQTISLLLGAGVDVNARNKDLYTPLSVVKNYKGPFSHLIARDLIKNGGTL